MKLLRGKWLLCIVAMLVLLGLAAPVFAQQQTYMVERGDTLASIARRFGVTLQSLVVANNIADPSRIKAGQFLVIPAVGGPVVQPALVHVVAPGEQLRFIAARYGTTWQAVAAANNLKDPNRIYVGQRLVIPAVGGPVVAPILVGGRYIVRAGDTLYRIGRMFGVDMWDIARANGILNLNQLRVGQALVIPGR